MSWILENADLTEKQVICSSASARTRDRLGKFCFALCGINMTSLLALLTLFLFNKTAEKRKKFDLRSSYQVRENADVLKIMLPLSIFETFCYGIFSLYGGLIYKFHNQLPAVTSQILLTSGYVVPYYTLVSPIIFSYLIRRSRRMRVTRMKEMTNRKDEAESYIQMCTEMWNRPVTKKN
ncbi:unnamed protein product [Cylicocyclus nassatus]|uniref:Uncharacterized protein n=1 Tax=Cylicocyclus nassatus TaxID=53992 RepID=A0AA36HEB9_CYLNA|nr:unnamed protein product [Cylicocyclus nassatus]